MAGPVRSLACVAWIALAVRGAAAEPTIVIAETRGTPSLPALASQVALQTGRRATVRTRPALDDDPMTYAERAAGLVSSGEATVVVWIAPVDRGFLVFAAGGWPGRALIELVRVDAALGSGEIERTVALKIAGLLDTVLAPPGRGVLGVDGAWRPAWRLEIAGGIAREPHQRGLDGRVGLAGGRAWLGRSRWLAAALGGYWQPTGAVDGAGGRASVTEAGAVVAVEAGRDVAAIQLFVRPRLVAAVLAARGASNDGRRGDAVVFAPYAGLEVGARRAIAGGLWLGVAIGSDLALIRHELVIDDELVVDVGRSRLHVGLSLTIAL